MAKSLVESYDRALRFVLSSLDSSRGEWPSVSRETNLSYFTIQKIAQRKIRRPSVEHLQTLMDHFRKAA